MTAGRNRWKLLAMSALMAIIWLVMLPRISRIQSIRTMIDSQQAAGIDPSAMFYSDLEHLSYRERNAAPRQVANGASGRLTSDSASRHRIDAVSTTTGRYRSGSPRIDGLHRGLALNPAKLGKKLIGCANRLGVPPILVATMVEKPVALALVHMQFAIDSHSN